ncbi:MAG TPA: trehalose-phosphatase [Acidimicrobiia bacterium]|nr:trehalose-phosphatase [Acidimicrobiia bacterium]
MPGHPGQVALARFASDPGHAAFITDFDGTLAPIVDDPAAARALPAALDALGALSERLALVAVVSGRPVAFLREHVALERVVLVGQYGLETLAGSRVVVDPRAAPYLAAVATAADEAARTWPELLVERKGEIAFTVHWRTAPGSAPYPDALAGLAARHGLETQPGRMACELRPPVPVDKGRAVERLLGRHAVDAAAFAGDDRGDLSVFDLFDELSVPADDADTGPALRCVRIAVRSSEAPPELIERADVVVNGPAGLAELLAGLVSALPARPA